MKTRLRDYWFLLASLAGLGLGLAFSAVGQAFAANVLWGLTGVIGFSLAVRWLVDFARSRREKGMIEKLTDPLTHLVRNAVDHGIEPPAHDIWQFRHAISRFEQAHASFKAVQGPTLEGHGLRKGAHELPP